MESVLDRELMAAVGAIGLMSRRMRFAGQKLQILWSIIVADAVEVMHNFARQQRAAQNVGHYQTVFQDVSALVGVRVMGLVD